jgi:hypothetical protein
MPETSIRKLILTALFLSAFLAHQAVCDVSGADCADTVKMKMIVANPSDSEVNTVPVKIYLPKGISADEIMDAGKFQISYDFERALYSASQEVMLEPKETVTMEIEMKDIWIISEDELAGLKKHTEEIIKAMRGSEYSGQVETLGQSVIERIGRILERQRQAGLPVEEKISGYEMHAAVLKEIKKDIGVLEDLAIEKNVPLGAVFMGEGSDVTGASGRTGDKAIDSEIARTVKFMIGASNTSPEKSIMPLKYYLPSEARPEYIVDNGGLDVGYDYNKGAHYVYKDAVELAPQERKEFTVEIKDIWVIPISQINAIKAHSRKLAQDVAGSQYEKTALQLSQKIVAALDIILEAQRDTAASVERHIGDYRKNLIKFDEARKDTARLEHIVIQAGGSAGVARTRRTRYPPGRARAPALYRAARRPRK